MIVMKMFNLNGFEMSWLFHLGFLFLFLGDGQCSTLIVHNISIPCGTLRSLHPQYSEVEWTREDKLNYLKYFDSGIVAENQREADENFRDLINSRETLQSLTEVSGMTILKRSDIISALKEIKGQNKTFDGLSLTDTKLTDYCRPRGRENDGYLHLCTECAGTTRLDSTQYWPSILNEAYCHPSETGCITIANSNHGKCFTSLSNVNLLRRRQGYCTLVLKGGQTVIMHAWRREMIPIKVGCECMVDRLSFLANYIPKPRMKSNENLQ
ncbi:unnamed protein product [Dimorphilus gyrociliatus]|uniref:Uncharacterized protein n=1 Tax=Dimorphilus gyrociliatus TaxID=2664684 RepID=A0A7I8VKI1_9ANNE|nr:unnamed protein product [Dimorphilus gyrociliatus]